MRAITNLLKCSVILLAVLIICFFIIVESASASPNCIDDQNCDLKVNITVDEDQINMSLTPDVDSNVAAHNGFEGFLMIFLPLDNNISNNSPYAIGKHNLTMLSNTSRDINVLLKLADDSKLDLECVLYCRATDNSMGGHQVGQQSSTMTPITRVEESCTADSACVLDPNTWGVSITRENETRKVPTSSDSPLHVINTSNPNGGYATGGNGIYTRDVVFSASSDINTRPGIYVNRVVYEVVLNP